MVFVFYVIFVFSVFSRFLSILRFYISVQFLPFPQEEYLSHFGFLFSFAVWMFFWQGRVDYIVNFQMLCLPLLQLV